MISLPTLTSGKVKSTCNFMVLTEYDFLTHSDRLPKKQSRNIQVLTEYDFLTHSDWEIYSDSIYNDRVLTEYDFLTHSDVNLGANHDSNVGLNGI